MTYAILSAVIMVLLYILSRLSKSNGVLTQINNSLREDVRIKDEQLLEAAQPNVDLDTITGLMKEGDL